MTRYRLIREPDHPLANNGWVAEHRAVLWSALGPGIHPCHWCGTLLLWGDIEVDHLNHQRDDNRTVNLVASCKPCNGHRHATNSDRNVTSGKGTGTK